MGVGELGGQLLGNGLGLGQTGLLGGDIDEVIDMAVVGGKVALGSPQRNAASGCNDFRFEHSINLHFLQMKKCASQPDHPGLRFRVAGGKRFFSLYNFESIFARKKEKQY
jgi:hypothetical protein